MNCDQLMCWRRLRERMREPISYPNDVTCVEPPLLAGNAISTINPKFMHYWNGKFWFAPSAILRLNVINISMRTCLELASLLRQTIWWSFYLGRFIVYGKLRLKVIIFWLLLLMGHLITVYCIPNIQGCICGILLKVLGVYIYIHIYLYSINVIFYRKLYHVFYLNAIIDFHIKNVWWRWMIWRNSNIISWKGGRHVHWNVNIWSKLWKINKTCKNANINRGAYSIES